MPGECDIGLGLREGNGTAGDEEPCFCRSGVSDLDGTQDTLFKRWNRDPLPVGFGARDLFIDEYGFEVRLGRKSESKRSSKCSSGECDSCRVVIAVGVDGGKSREYQHRDGAARVIGIREPLCRFADSLHHGGRWIGFGW